MKEKKEIIKKVVEFYYKFKINYILEFILAIPFTIFLLRLRYDKIHTGVWFLNELIPTVILGVLIIAIIITNIIKQKSTLEKMFLSFAIPIGMMYAIYMIPTYVPDENAHVYRAYQISIGNFIEIREEDKSSYVDIPENIVESMITSVNNYTDLFNKIEGNNDYSQTTEKSNAAQSYFPTLYALSAIGMFVGKTLLLNPIVTMYLAKILNFIAFLVLGYWSIKKIPFGKLVVLTYLMLPMVLQQAISVSADSLTNSVAIFFIAYTLYLVKRDTVMTKKEEIFYYILVAFIALAKIAYMPMVAISWLFIGNKNYNKKHKLRVILISTIMGVILSLGWYTFSSINYPDDRSYLAENGVNSGEQIKYIISHPIEYIKVILRTIYYQGETYLYMFVGKNLGWLDINTKMIVIIGFMILAVFSPFLIKEKITFNNKERLWILAVFAGIFAITLTGLYLGWTTVGAPLVTGIQGRYFIPIGILLLLCMCVKGKFLEFKHINIAYPILLSLLNLSILNSIIWYFV